MKMKTSVYALTLLCVWAVSAKGTPLAKNQVSSEAKWLLHFDLDNFRETKIGAFVIKDVLQKKFEKEFNKAAALLQDKPKIDFQKFRSITAYGANYESHSDSVLLIQTGQDMHKILDSFVSNDKKSETSGPAIPLKKLSEGALTFYSLNGDIYGSIFADNLLLISKSKEQIEKAHGVLAGSSPNLKSKDAFAAFSAVPNSFFFLAIAEAFNAKAAIPPQAKVLQMAEGGRLVVGEKTNHLFLDLSLRGKSAEVTTQIQQIVQGAVALIALSQGENEDLMRLAQSLKVSTRDNFVTLTLEYPVSKAIEKLDVEVSEAKIQVNFSDKTDAESGSKKEKE
jgi:hypothetical protein